MKLLMTNYSKKKNNKIKNWKDTRNPFIKMDR